MDKQKKKFEDWKRKMEIEAENERFKLVPEPEPVVVDPVAEAEARHAAEMTDPATAPSWARPASNEAYVAPPQTSEDIAAKLAALEKEHEAAVKALAAIQSKQVAVLNEKLAAQKKAEEAAAQDEASALPGRMAEVLAEVKGFVPANETPAPVYSEANDPILRGQEALARARRKLNGEQVEEPELPPYVPPVKPGETVHQSEVRARIAPALATAEERRAELAVWSAKMGPMLDELYTERGGHEEQKLIRSLLRGVPGTQANTSAVQSLVTMVQATVDIKVALEKTLDRETKDLEIAVQSIPGRGSMVSMGDRSTAYYLLEREIVGCVTRLATVSTDSIADLWNRAREVVKRLLAITALRAENVGKVVPPVEFESKSLVVEDARRASEGYADERARAITNENLFGRRA